MKAIKTKYLDYDFRSRLEARWAVFFTAAAIAWKYEPEAFDLGNGIFYLPDFWLPDHEVWIEIKPWIWEDTPFAQSIEIRRAFMKCRLLSRQVKQPVILFAGDVWPCEYRLYGLDWDDPTGEPFGAAQLKQCHHCRGLCFEAEHGWGNIGTHKCGNRDGWPREFSAEFWSAARFAYFDHGETS
jgi:hypothetical protein